VVTPAIVCLANFFGTWFYDVSGFLIPIGEYYDAIALACLYLLFITYATPPEARGGPKQLFKTIPALHAQHEYQNVKGSGLQAYYRTWVFVFQIIFVRLITTVVTMITYGTVCKQLQKSTVGHTVLTIISTLSTVACFVSVLRLMKFIKPSLQGQRALFKTVSLKGLIGFSVLLNLIFSILKTANAIHPTKYMNKQDWFIGLPDLMTCCAGLIFSILIIIPFNTSPYSATAMPNAPKKNFFIALLDVLNFSDVLFVAMSKLPEAFSSWKSKDSSQGSTTYNNGYKNVPPYAAPAYNQEVQRPTHAHELRPQQNYQSNGI